MGFRALFLFSILSLTFIVSCSTASDLSETTGAILTSAQDKDSDGVNNQIDNCVDIANSNQQDSDGDKSGDACDDDDDNDGIKDATDNCPIVANPLQKNLDGDSLGDACDDDIDGDTILNSTDNCPDMANADQIDANNDGFGDVCDPNKDSDSDGIINSMDNCPLTSNSSQIDTDTDGSGDACDSDDDGDGIDDNSDNCPINPNADQTDSESDGQGNVCDSDDDNDGQDDSSDNCPINYNPSQDDMDNDGIGDVCDNNNDTDTDSDGIIDVLDNCPTTTNANQLDTDGDNIGDACDSDDDGDGINDATDNCPLVSNANQANLDGDGLGDVCDSDDDNDGIADQTDNCSMIPNVTQEDIDNDGFGDVCDGDDDGDGFLDLSDNCPKIGNPGQEDSDDDGLGDACEAVLQPFSQTLEGDTLFQNLGASATPLNDIDGDGLKDIALLSALELRVVSSMSFNSLSGSTLWQVDLDDIDCDAFSSRIINVGDISGDGKEDIMVGSPKHQGSGTVPFGKACFFSGANGDNIYDIDGDTLNPYNYFGQAAASAGDVDGDGYGDFLVGAPYFQYDGVGGKEGRVYLYSGKDKSLLNTMNGDSNAIFGYFIANLGDVTGDGIPDIAIDAEANEANGAGGVYIYSGSALTTSTASNGNYFSPEIVGNPGYFGRKVSAIADLNNNGIRDILIASPKWNGRVYAFDGLTKDLITELIAPDQPTNFDAQFGSAIASAGDFNADAREDIIVGAYSYDAAYGNMGKTYVFSGKDLSLLFAIEGTGSNQFMGWNVFGLGDLNGDTFDEVATTAHGANASGVAQAGIVHIFSFDGL